MTTNGVLSLSYELGYHRRRIDWFDVDAKGKSKDAGVFIDGFLTGKKIYGRPVDLKFDKQGNLYITDDSAGIIYKVSKI